MTFDYDYEEDDKKTTTFDDMKDYYPHVHVYDPYATFDSSQLEEWEALEEEAVQENKSRAIANQARLDARDAELKHKKTLKNARVQSTNADNLNKYTTK